MGNPLNNRIKHFCEWLQSAPLEPHFTELPEFVFFAGIAADEMLAVEQELVRRIAVLGTEQGVRFTSIKPLQI